MIEKVANMFFVHRFRQCNRCLPWARNSTGEHADYMSVSIIYLYISIYRLYINVNEWIIKQIRSPPFCAGRLTIYNRIVWTVQMITSSLWASSVDLMRADAVVNSQRFICFTTDEQHCVEGRHSPGLRQSLSSRWGVVEFTQTPK